MGFDAGRGARRAACVGQVLLSEGVVLTIQGQAGEASDRGVAYARKTGCDIKPDGPGGAFWLRLSGGGGDVRLRGLAVHNSSAPAVVAAPSSRVRLHTDLFFPHGRYGQVSLAGGGLVAPNSDARSAGRELDCSAGRGCVDAGPAFQFDARFQGPLTGNAAACTDCWVPVGAGTQGGSLADAASHFGLSAVIVAAGRNCQRGGELEAVLPAGTAGSGFAARFSVEDGAATRVALVSPGSGYASAEDVSIRVGAGGDGCEGLEFRALLLHDSSYR
jgi:hypothetical protein